MERSDTSLFCDCWHILRSFFRSLIDNENASVFDRSYASVVLSLMEDIENDVFPY